MFENPQLKKILALLDKAVLENIVIYEMKTITPFYDFSIVTSAKSARQGNAAVDYLKKEANVNNLTLRSFSASTDSGWFLVDLTTVVVHIFVGEERTRFNLDGLYYALPKASYGE